jgi:hypothetical protein
MQTMLTSAFVTGTSHFYIIMHCVPQRYNRLRTGSASGIPLQYHPSDPAQLAGGHCDCNLRVGGAAHLLQTGCLPWSSSIVTCFVYR